MRNIANTLYPLLTAATLLMCALSTAVFAKDINETFDVSAGGTLNLRTQAGSLKIETHDSNTVILEVETDGESADDFEITHSSNGTDLEIKGELKSRKRWVNNLRIKFKLTVPNEYNLDMHTSGGSINIQDLTGNIDAHTSGGSITVGSVKGKVELHTSGGSINTEAIYGPLDAHTSGGSINVTFAEQLTEDAELDTSGGSINAYLIDNIEIDIDASTSGGRVRSDFTVDGRVKKRSIRGKINGGGPELKLHTSGGSVSIRSL